MFLRHIFIHLLLNKTLSNIRFLLQLYIHFPISEHSLYPAEGGLTVFWTHHRTRGDPSTPDTATEIIQSSKKPVSDQFLSAVHFKVTPVLTLKVSEQQHAAHAPQQGPYSQRVPTPPPRLHQNMQPKAPQSKFAGEHAASLQSVITGRRGCNNSSVIL